MPMPHRTQRQLIKRRLMGKDGAERARELRSILAELPGYRNGPYADLRKWVEGEIEATRTRRRVVSPITTSGSAPDGDTYSPMRVWTSRI